MPKRAAFPSTLPGLLLALMALHQRPDGRLRHHGGYATRRLAAAVCGTDSAYTAADMRSVRDSLARQGLIDRKGNTSKTTDIWITEAGRHRLAQMTEEEFDASAELAGQLGIAAPVHPLGKSAPSATPEPLEELKRIAEQLDSRSLWRIVRGITAVLDGAASKQQVQEIELQALRAELERLADQLRTALSLRDNGTASDDSPPAEGNGYHPSVAAFIAPFKSA